MGSPFPQLDCLYYYNQFDMKNRMMSAAFAVITIGSAWSFTKTPRSAADFTGNWAINLEKSEHGESSPKAMKLTQTKDSLFIERITNDDKSFVEKISFDGKTCVTTTTSGRRKSGTAKWNNEGTSFTETAVLGDVPNADKVAFSVVEHWQLSEDGKQVTVESEITVVGKGQFAMKAVYDRQ